jgi:hypothetical protein
VSGAFVGALVGHWGWFEVWSLGFRVLGFGFCVLGLSGFRVLGLRASGFGVWAFALRKCTEFTETDRDGTLILPKAQNPKPKTLNPKP